MDTDLGYFGTEMPWHVEYPLETFIEVTSGLLVTRRVCRADSVLYNSTRPHFAELGRMPLGFDRELEEELPRRGVVRDSWRRMSRADFDALWVDSVRYVEDHFDALRNRIAGEAPSSLE